MTNSHRCVVLVINDDITQLGMVCAVLEKGGYDAVPSTDGGDALRRLDAGFEPALIITDIQMPGVDGWQFCKLVRTHVRPAVAQVPLLAMSAVFDGERPATILSRLGANDFMQVPFRTDELLAKVTRLTGGGGEQKQPSRALVIAACDADVPPLEKTPAALDWTFLFAPSLEQGVENVEFGSFDTVLFVDSPGRVDAQRFIQTVRAQGYCGVVIAVTQTKPRAALLLRSGADDCIVGEPEAEHLGAVCEKSRFEKAFRDVKEVLDDRTWELQESRERYRLMMDSMADCVYIISPDFHLEYLNPAAVASLGRAAQGDMCYRSLFGFSAPCSWCPMEACSETPVRIEFELPGGSHNYHCTFARLEHPDGSCSYMSVLRDMTRERRLEKQLRQAERMEALGHLAGGIAHDFNNMLGAILGYAEMIALESEEGDQGPAVQALGKRIGIIRSAADRASRLVRKLLAYSRQGQFRATPVSIHETVDEVLGILRHSLNKNIAIETTLSASDIVVNGDPGQLQSMLLNLAINARDAMPQGGTLTIATSNRTLFSEWMPDDQQCIPAGDYICIEVCDTGIGMDEQTKARIFDPFFTTKEAGKGTGLGLASVYGTVKNHEGYIVVFSTPGTGSTFSLYLPLSLRSHGGAAPGTESAMLPVAQGECLVVDDEELVRETTCEMLQCMGLQARGFAGAAQAVEYLRSSTAIPALVVVDMIMPEANGMECIAAIRKLKGDVPCILATGYTMDADAQAAQEEGIRYFLHKPFSKNELQSMVVDALKGSLCNDTIDVC